MVAWRIKNTFNKTFNESKGSGLFPGPQVATKFVQGVQELWWSENYLEVDEHLSPNTLDFFLFTLLKALISFLTVSSVLNSESLSFLVSVRSSDGAAWSTSTDIPTEFLSPVLKHFFVNNK